MPQISGCPMCPKKTAPDKVWENLFLISAELIVTDPYAHDGSIYFNIRNQFFDI